MQAETRWPAFAGIDWGGDHHQLCVVDPSGAKQLERRVPHDVAGLLQLDDELARFTAVMPVAIERAEGLLVEHLQAHGHVVFAVSPRIAARARERYRVASVKDDRFDAFVLADTLRHEHAHWRALSVPSPLLAEVRALTRDRDRLLETQQATEAQLRSILEAYHPAPTKLFSSIDRQITLSFVQEYPTPQSASRLRATRVGGFCRRNHYSGRVPPDVLAERLRANLLSGAEGTVAGKSFSAGPSPGCSACSTSSWPSSTTPSQPPSPSIPTLRSSPASPASALCSPGSCCPRSARTGPGSPPPTSCSPRPASRP